MTSSDLVLETKVGLDVPQGQKIKYRSWSWEKRSSSWSWEL